MISRLNNIQLAIFAATCALTFGATPGRADPSSVTCLDGVVELGDYTLLSQDFRGDFQDGHMVTINLTTDMPSITLSVLDLNNNELCVDQSADSSTKTCTWKRHGGGVYNVRVDNSAGVVDAGFTMCRDDGLQAIDSGDGASSSKWGSETGD